MYKVFIDHKPILLVKENEIVKRFHSIEIDSIKVFPDDIEVKLLDVSIDSPLQIICKDVEKAFKRLFSKHELIVAAGGIVEKEDKYLMIFRNGMWDIPKGKLEDNEVIQKAAIREVEEECGITKPEIEFFIASTFHTYNYKGLPVLKKTYWYKMNYSGSEELTAQQEEGITKVEWMSANEMFAIRGNTYGSINEVLDIYRDSLLD